MKGEIIRQKRLWLTLAFVLLSIAGCATAAHAQTLTELYSIAVGAYDMPCGTGDTVIAWPPMPPASGYTLGTNWFQGRCGSGCTYWPAQGTGFWIVGTEIHHYRVGSDAYAVVGKTNPGDYVSPYLDGPGRTPPIFYPQSTGFYFQNDGVSDLHFHVACSGTALHDALMVIYFRLP